MRKNNLVPNTQWGKETADDFGGQQEPTLTCYTCAKEQQHLAETPYVVMYKGTSYCLLHIPD